MFFLISQEVFGQRSAEKYENVDWVRVVMVKFKAGKAGPAQDIINNHFRVAGKRTGNPMATSYEISVGHWDHMVVFPMSGPSVLEYSTTPENVDWWNQMIELEGSAEKAQEVWDTYMSYVDNSISFLARKQKN